MYISRGLQTVLHNKRQLNRHINKKEYSKTYDYKGKLLKLIKSKNTNLPDYTLKSSFDVINTSNNDCKTISRPRYTSEVLDDIYNISESEKMATLLIKPVSGVFINNGTDTSFIARKDTDNTNECKSSQKETNRQSSYCPVVNRKVVRKLKNYFNTINIAESLTIPSKIHTYEGRAECFDEFGVGRKVSVLPKKTWKRIRLKRMLTHKYSFDLKESRKLPPPPLGFSYGHGIFT